MRYLDRITDQDATPLTWLTETLNEATALHAQVGYLDWAGFQLIAAPVQDMLDRGGRLRIVVDARNDLPRHGDLRQILERLAPYGERATIRLAQDAMPLHSKVFFINDAAGSAHALVGSANLTRAGLTKNWESCIALGPADAATAEVRAAAEAWASHPSCVTVDVGVLSSLVTPDPRTGASVRIGLGMAEVLDRIEQAGKGAAAGLLTGFTDLDRLLGGLWPGEMVLIAGRPSMGKSTLALDVLRYNSVRGDLPAAMLSFEMSRPEILTRLLSAETKIPHHVLRSGRMTDDEWKRLAQRMAELVERPLFINDSCNPSIRHVAAEARRLVTEESVELVVVDYVQQLNADRRVDSRQHELAEVSRALKHLGRELQIPILVVSQLNRGPELRNDKRPQLFDLRDTGGLEQDADVVIFVHRDDYYDKEHVRAGEADFIVAKHRNGPTDFTTVAAQLHYCRFVDLADF